MPLVPDLGIASDYISSKKWSLVSLDDPNNSFTGQFEAENVTENVGARLTSTTPVGQSSPVIQFSSGEKETVTFRARIYRTSPISGSLFETLSDPLGTAFNALGGGEVGPLVSNSSVRDQIDKLKSFSRINPELGRPEIFSLTIGTELQYEVFLRSPGSIVYDKPRSDGTIRGATFDMQCEKTRPETEKPETGISTAALVKSTLGVVGAAAGVVAAAGVIDIPGASLHTIDKIVTVKEGDTFESIAFQQYGNPLLGDILRRAQPDKLDLPTDGDNKTEIITIKRNEILQIAVTPQAIPLRSNTKNKALLNEFLELRGNPATLIV